MSEEKDGGNVHAFRSRSRSSEPRDALGMFQEIIANHSTRAIYVAFVTDQDDGVHIHDAFFGPLKVTEATHIGAMLHERAFGRDPDPE